MTVPNRSLARAIGMTSRYRRRHDRTMGKTYYEHRAFAEWRIGRPLRPDEVVHHRNSNPLDNHPDNLEVLPSQGVHMLGHHLERRAATGAVPIFDRATLLSGLEHRQREGVAAVSAVALGVLISIVSGRFSSDRRLFASKGVLDGRRHERRASHDES